MEQINLKDKLLEYAESIDNAKNKDKENPDQLLLEAYKYIKNNYDIFNIRAYDYILALRNLRMCENNMPKKYICDCNVYFSYPKDDIDIKRLGEIDVLNALTTINRKLSLDLTSDIFIKNKDYNSLDTTNLCKNTTRLFEIYCKHNNIKCQRIKIAAGFDENIELFDGCGFHYFNIVTVNNEKYIYDVTYKQFFKIKDNFFQKLGIIGHPPTSLGKYMIIEEKRKKTAEELLKKGFIPYNEENLKNYLDGFALSYRNGLYYEQVGNTNYNTIYTFDDYERFLFTDDSQVKHESIDVLGYQYKELKNPNFDFNYHKTL